MEFDSIWSWFHHVFFSEMMCLSCVYHDVFIMMLIDMLMIKNDEHDLTDDFLLILMKLDVIFCRCGMAMRRHADLCGNHDGSMVATRCCRITQGWSRQVKQTVSGQLHCKDCGNFFAGQRGLQDHQRQKHNKAGRWRQAKQGCEFWIWCCQIWFQAFL